MSWYPCGAEDCENGCSPKGDEEPTFCDVHKALDRTRRALEKAKELIDFLPCEFNAVEINGKITHKEHCDNCHKCSGKIEIDALERGSNDRQR